MSDFKQTWIESFNKLAIELAGKYKEDPEPVLSCMKLRSQRDCLLETYNNLVGQKEITRLEDLSPAEKQKYWLMSKKYSDEQFQRILICKAIYLLDLLTEDK